MKTKGLYIATAYITTFLRNQESKAFQYNDKVIYYEPMKKVLVLSRENKYGKRDAIDLNTGEKYPWDTPSDQEYKIFIYDEYQSFNEITGNTKTRLSKRKIKELGNKKLY